MVEQDFNSDSKLVTCPRISQFMSFRSEAAEKGVRTRRATEGTAGVLEPYAEEPDRAQRRPQALIRRRSTGLMNHPGS